MAWCINCGNGFARCICVICNLHVGSKGFEQCRDWYGTSVATPMHTDLVMNWEALYCIKWTKKGGVWMPTVRDTPSSSFQTPFA